MNLKEGVEWKVEVVLFLLEQEEKEKAEADARKKRGEHETKKGD